MRESLPYGKDMKNVPAKKSGKQKRDDDLVRKSRPLPDWMVDPSLLPKRPPGK